MPAGRTSSSCARPARAIRSSRSARSSATSRARKGSWARRHMASVDVPVALLGYGTVGSAINYFLTQNADDIERATGHRLRVVKALVRDVEKERDFNPPPGVLTTDFAEILNDP